MLHKYGRDLCVSTDLFRPTCSGPPISSPQGSTQSQTGAAYIQSECGVALAVGPAHHAGDEMVFGAESEARAKGDVSTSESQAMQD